MSFFTNINISKIFDSSTRIFQKKKDFQTIGSIEEYERLALIEEAQAEMLEDEKEKFKKQSLDLKLLLQDIDFNSRQDCGPQPMVMNPS